MFRFAVRDNSTAIMAVVAILGFFAYWTDVGLVAIPRSIPDFLVFYIVKVFRVRPEHGLGTGETSPPVSWSFMVWPSDPSLDWATPWAQMREMCFNPAAQALITTISMTMYTAKEVGKTVAFAFTDNHRWMPDWKRTKIEKRVAEINAQRRLETPSPELRRHYRDAERQGWERQVRRERQFERELESEREIVRRYGAYATAESIRYCRSLLITRAKPFAYKSTACKTPDFRQRREREERDRERAAEPAAHHQAHTKKLICSPQDIMPNEVYKNPDGTLKDPVTAQTNLDRWETERASSRPEIPALFLTAPTPQHQFLQQAAAPIEPSGKASRFQESLPQYLSPSLQ
ncbi:hypothetical protein NUW58_g5985 [Xylaria curta]|uniref:Uncharacterized protein n=1 Tax=Xylaria curta TaxID=42375 RepID=A0ACC1P0L5_9PEZI|nr:hypothetical protein NUW58_g5985 [Xylaria curta]